MSFKLDSEAVDLEERRLPDSLFQHIEALEMMGIVPINGPPLKIGPVHYLSFGKPKTLLPTPNQLNQGLHSVKESGTGVGCDRHVFRAQSETVSLFGKDRLVAIGRFAD